MTSYPAKPYVVPNDDWFNNNSINFKKSITNQTKTIYTVHEFFYRQSNVKVGGSDNFLGKNLEKKSSKKIIISSLRNSDKCFLSSGKKKYIYYKISRELKSIKKRPFQGKTSHKNLSNKNIFNFRKYLLDVKSIFLKIIRKKDARFIMTDSASKLV